MQLSQPLSKDGTAKHYTSVKKYGALLQDNLGVMNVMWLSDEAHFQLNGYINLQNVRFWGSENPRLTVSAPMDPQTVLV
jgi:hypothetical protein